MDIVDNTDGSDSSCFCAAYNHMNGWTHFFLLWRLAILVVKMMIAFQDDIICYF